MRTLSSRETLSPQRKELLWTTLGSIVVTILLAIMTDGWNLTQLPATMLMTFIAFAFSGIYPEKIPAFLRPRPAVLPGIIWGLVLSACIVAPRSLIYEGGNVTYVQWIKWRSPFSSSSLNAAPLLKGTLTLKQMDMDDHVVREDERSWFLVTVMYEVRDPHALTASEWAWLKTGTLPLNELPLSFDSAPDQVVEAWLKKNLPHVTTRVQVVYHSPAIVWE